LRLEEIDPAVFALKWHPAQSGRKPAAFKIYASNEKGFEAHDQTYVAPVGNQKFRGLYPGEKTRKFPANLLATVKETSFRLVPEHAFYRVVAVDDRGNESGSSDYLAAPRPFIYSKPVTEGRAGQPYRYEVKTVYSIGDLSFRDYGAGQSYQSAYWDADKPKFSLETELPRCGTFDPPWLTIDPVTGVLAGVPGPNDATEHQINVKVEIPGAGVFIQSFPLRIHR
jgi:hypothetical protein